MNTNRIQYRGRGVAMVLVVAMVALASVLALTMLSSSTINAAANSNGDRSVQAAYLAESGVNLAAYYLANPSKAPVIGPGGYYPGQNNISLGPLVNGSVSVQVTKLSSPANTYNVQSVSQSVGGMPRTLNVRFEVTPQSQVTEAASFAGDFTVPSTMTVNGTTKANGVLTVTSGAVVGTVKALGSTLAVWEPMDAEELSCPKLDTIILYNAMSSIGKTYLHNGVVCQAEPLSGTVSGTINVSSPASNPKRIFYTNGPVILANCTINGSVIAYDSNLAIGGNARVTPDRGVPAVIVGKDLMFNTAYAGTFTVDGLLYVGQHMKASLAALGNMNINGALMMGSSTARVDPTVLTRTTVNYVPANVDIPDLSTDPAASVVRVDQWGD